MQFCLGTIFTSYENKENIIVLFKLLRSFVMVQWIIQNSIYLSLLFSSLSFLGSLVILVCVPHLVIPFYLSWFCELSQETKTKNHLVLYSFWCETVGSRRKTKTYMLQTTKCDIIIMKAGKLPSQKVVIKTTKTRILVLIMRTP